MYQEVSAGLSAEPTAVITDIERFALHDGPGIRTMVFFKGCPLRCRWCQNPETWDPNPEPMYYREQCIGCGECITACPQHALCMTEDGLRRNAEQCRNCGTCAHACCSGAMHWAGRRMSVGDVFHEVMKDHVFYRDGGGVTLSGGECTMHAAFVQNFLQRAKQNGLHTAIETCGFCAPERFQRLLPWIDLLLFDIKVPIEERSRQYTGQGCEVILQNLSLARRMNREVILRLPLIPGVNNDDITLRCIGEIAQRNTITKLHILPFHQAGSNKWKALERTYTFAEHSLLTEEETEHARALLCQYIPNVSIGGSQY